MPIQFNAAYDPWIIVQQKDELKTLSLQDTLLNAHKIFVVNGDEERQDRALERFLCGTIYALLTQAVSEIPDSEKSEDVKENYQNIVRKWVKNGKIDPDLITRYFADRKELFNVVSDTPGIRPFMQFPEFDKHPLAADMSIKALKGSVAESNNQVATFALETPDQFMRLDIPEALRWMIFFGFYGHCAAKIKDRSNAAFEDEHCKAIRESKKQMSYSAGFGGQAVQIWAQGLSLFDTLLMNTAVFSDRIPDAFLQSSAFWDTDFDYNTLSGENVQGGALLYTTPRDWMRLNFDKKDRIESMTIYGYTRFNPIANFDPHVELNPPRVPSPDKPPLVPRPADDSQITASLFWNNVKNILFEGDHSRSLIEHLRNLANADMKRCPVSISESKQLYKSSSCGAYGNYLSQTIPVPGILIRSDTEQIESLRRIVDLYASFETTIRKYAKSFDKKISLKGVRPIIEQELQYLSDGFESHFIKCADFTDLHLWINSLKLAWNQMLERIENETGTSLLDENNAVAFYTFRKKMNGFMDAELSEAENEKEEITS